MALRLAGWLLIVVGGGWLFTTLFDRPLLTMYLLRTTPMHTVPPPLAFVFDLATPAGLALIGVRLLKRRHGKTPP